jgi:hypothetical protein
MPLPAPNTPLHMRLEALGRSAIETLRYLHHIGWSTMGATLSPAQTAALERLVVANIVRQHGPGWYSIRPEAYALMEHAFGATRPTTDECAARPRAPGPIAGRPPALSVPPASSTSSSAPS